LIDERLFKKALDLHKQGKHAEADEKYDSLLKADPANAHVLHAKGLLYMHRKSFQEALGLFQRAVDADKNLPIVRQSIGQLFEQVNMKVEAAGAYADYAAYLVGNRNQEALEACRKSLSLHPNPLAEKIRALALEQMGDPTEAEKEYRQIISSLKNSAKSVPDLMMLSDAHLSLLELEPALKCAQKAVRLDPASSSAQQRLAFLLLMQGDFPGGFAAFEHRWAEDSEYVDKKRVGFYQPQWKGETPQEVNAILVVAEQTFGDNIQFARYARMLADLGHTVLFEADWRIVSLFQEGFAHRNIRTIPRQYFKLDKWHLGWLAERLGHRRQKAPPYAVYRDLPFAMWVGSMSLPRLFGTTVDNMPGNTPYLSIKPAKIRRWRQRFQANAGKPKIGLVWSGDPNHVHDYKRSIKPALLMPLIQRTDVAFYSLQTGSPAAYEFPPGTVTKLDQLLTDFTETGAAMMCLDLIITVDTASAHLAGALNRPVWIMMPKIKDWRWQKEGETIGWYPTARLFRHPKLGDWEGTVANVNAALDQFVGAWKPEPRLKPTSK
jgi:tetratricopeptide (TPR) repeat protein